MGYRFDFEKLKVVATGGIYVRTQPALDKVTIDSKILLKPSLFSNWVFVPNLLPGDHNIVVEKIGYYSYIKTLPVQEKEVVKVENILFIKKDSKFEPLSAKEKSPFDITIKPTISLGPDGILYQSEPNEKTPKPLTTNAIKVGKKPVYKISVLDQNILLTINGSVLIYNKEKKDLEPFLATSNYKKIIDCQWINNYHVVFTDGEKIIISETDLRSNTNIVTLPKIDNFSSIYFSQQDGRLYIKTSDSILVSEKIL